VLKQQQKKFQLETSYSSNTNYWEDVTLFSLSRALCPLQCSDRLKQGKVTDVMKQPHTHTRRVVCHCAIHNYFCCTTKSPSVMCVWTRMEYIRLNSNDLHWQIHHNGCKKYALSLPLSLSHTHTIYISLKTKVDFISCWKQGYLSPSPYAAVSDQHLPALSSWAADYQRQWLSLVIGKRNKECTRWKDRRADGKPQTSLSQLLHNLLTPIIALNFRFHHQMFPSK